MSNVIDLQQELKKGLYINNLSTMAKQCIRIAKNSPNPLPYYALANVFYDLIREWDERPLLTSEVTEMEQSIGPQLQQALQALSENDKSQKSVDYLNDLLQTFLNRV